MVMPRPIAILAGLVASIAVAPILGGACGTNGRPLTDHPPQPDGASADAPMADADAARSDAAPLDAGRARAVDILFMVDNSSEMTEMQQKLVTQLPAFVHALENLPGGLPDVHIAVVSSDMGAPGDSTTSIQCTKAGDQGMFQFTPRGTCTASGLAAGATFISNVGGVANYTGALDETLSCIALLGSNGCGFEHQLASVVRALGADGTPPPPQNAGFLRPDAELAIFLLTNEDDCSAPADTTLYSLNGAPQSLTNPLGPIQNYRCNQFGHLCQDPTGSQPTSLLPPPLELPPDATGDQPELTLTGCVSNDGPGGMLTPLATFVNQIKALKPDPSRIVVGAIIGPPTPYAVTWVPAFSQPAGTTGQLWPFAMHSCGGGGYGVNPAAQMSTDGSFGDPGVRVNQWVQAFGGVTGSVCDGSYGAALGSFAAAIAQHL
jgi:hypothetical protein